MMHSCWLLMAASLLTLGAAFPDGAPVDACVKAKPNQPYHSQLAAQPQHSNPYQIIASSKGYQPGAKITVTIQGAEPFRGFFVQARDGKTGSWIGTWDSAPNTKGIPECSAVTHGDNQDKVQATLIWSPPENLVKSGNIYFTGSIVKDYATFWTDVVALAPQ